MRYKVGDKVLIKSAESIILMLIISITEALLKRDLPLMQQD